MWRMRIACWIIKAVDTHLQNVTTNCCPTATVLCERALLLRSYVYFLSFCTYIFLVGFYKQIRRVMHHTDIYIYIYIYIYVCVCVCVCVCVYIYIYIYIYIFFILFLKYYYNGKGNANELNGTYKRDREPRDKHGKFYVGILMVLLSPSIMLHTENLKCRGVFQKLRLDLGQYRRIILKWTLKE